MTILILLFGNDSHILIGVQKKLLNFSNRKNYYS